MNEKEKRKILISSIIIIITLILVVVGTTYAFFSLQIEGEETTTNVEITTGEQNEITLSGGITNYHIKLDVSDMTEDKIGTPYYGTTASGKNYEEKEEDGTKDIGTLTKKGTITEKYMCSADINISLDGDMQEFLQANDLVLVVKQGSTSSTYDLSNVSAKNTFKFKLDNDNINSIKAYLKFTNQESDQSDLAGTSLNISINIDNFACEIDNSKSALEMLTEKGEETFTLKNGMYRFVGTKDEVTNNYICFGTDDAEKCLDTPDNYMYRIIGLTSEDDSTINLPAHSLKLIKAVPSSTSQPWHSVYTQEDCEIEGIDECTWDDSDMKTYLNETFLTDMDSKWESPEYWKELITSQKWYNADQPDWPGQTEEPKTSTTNGSYQVGLMYATDYANSLNVSTEISIYYESSWLYLYNDWSGYPGLSEWTMSRKGFVRWRPGYDVYTAYSGPDAVLSSALNNSTILTRPVFYLLSDITLTGEGNTENPFIIHTN